MQPADPPMISVVIPARNEESSIEAAIESVVGQCYRLDRLECIVVDNGSTDATAARVRSFRSAGNHPSIRLLSEPEEGVSHAKNRGAEAASGSILVFLDADSRMSASLAGEVAKSYTAAGIGFAPAGSIRVVADSRHPLERGFFALMEVGKMWFGVRAQMLYCDRRLFLEVGGFRPDLRLGEDVDFLARVKARLRADGRGTVGHIRTGWIVTSPRRLRAQPFHLGMFVMFGRWALAFAGIGRTRKY